MVVANALDHCVLLDKYTHVRGGSGQEVSPSVDASLRSAGAPANVKRRSTVGDGLHRSIIAMAYASHTSFPLPGRRQVDITHDKPTSGPFNLSLVDVALLSMQGDSPLGD